MDYVKTPVLFICYNRLDLVRISFACIRKNQPRILYIASDGGKDAEDWEKVQNVRGYLEENIDWDCVVKKRYSEKNQGCQLGPYHAIDWLFENEESGIIIEDDIKPRDEFWNFCDRMLEKYWNDEKVMVVTGCNLIQDYDSSDSYLFTEFPSFWGWATWKRAWLHMDIEMKAFPKLIKEHFFEKKYGWETAYCFKRDFREVYEGRLDAWDYPWLMAILQHDGLGVVPRDGLNRNIGVGNAGGTHTNTNFIELKTAPLDKNLREPQEMIPDDRYDKLLKKKIYYIHPINEILKKILPERIVAWVREKKHG